MKPSQFAAVHPWNSIAGNSENESLACSIMKTKVFKNNDSFTNEDGSAVITNYSDYLEYRDSIRAKRRDCANSEQFYKIAKWCRNEDTAKLFSKSWEEIK